LATLAVIGKFQDSSRPASARSAGLRTCAQSRWPKCWIVRSNRCSLTMIPAGTGQAGSAASSTLGQDTNQDHTRSAGRWRPSAEADIVMLAHSLSSDWWLARTSWIDGTRLRGAAPGIFRDFGRQAAPSRAFRVDPIDSTPLASAVAANSDLINPHR